MKKEIKNEIRFIIVGASFDKPPSTSTYIDRISLENLIREIFPYEVNFKIEQVPTGIAAGFPSLLIKFFSSPEVDSLVNLLTLTTFTIVSLKQICKKIAKFLTLHRKLKELTNEEILITPEIALGFVLQDIFNTDELVSKSTIKSIKIFKRFRYPSEYKLTEKGHIDFVYFFILFSEKPSPAHYFGRRFYFYSIQSTGNIVAKEIFDVEGRF